AAARAPPAPTAGTCAFAAGVVRPGGFAVAVAAVAGRSLRRGRVRLGVRPVPAAAAPGGLAAAATGGRPPAFGRASRASRASRSLLAWLAFLRFARSVAGLGAAA